MLGIETRRVELALASLARRGFLGRHDLRSAEPASIEDLARVHPGHYLEASADPPRLAAIFGLDAASIRSDEILMSQRRAAGGTVAAAEAVLASGLSVGFNLGGGFHHAEPERGSGFCVYNDIAVAIRRIRSHGFDGSIAIIDLDYHDGNGNAVTFAEDPSVLTYSIHGSTWSHVEAVRNIAVLLPPGTQDAAYMKAMEETLRPALLEQRPQLCFYIAGNDVLGGDRLGDFELSLAGVLERDLKVLKWVEEIGSKLVITLGGGYSPAAWRCTANLMISLLGGSVPSRSLRRDDPEAEEVFLQERFNEVFQSIDPSELQRESESKAGFEVSEEEILGDLSGSRRSHRVLDYYSKHGIEYAFERYGILGKIRGLGFEGLRFDINPSDPARQSLRIFGKKSGRSGALEEHLLVELVVGRKLRPADAELGYPEVLELLTVEWLLLQDPTADFTLRKPPLPGQKHPGLGISREIQELLVQVCRRLELDGILSNPSHFHNAWVMSRWYRFVDPAIEGRMHALHEVLATLSLADATQAVEQGKLRLAEGDAVRWIPSDQIYAVSEPLVAYFGSERYRRAVAEAKQRLLRSGLRLDGAPAPRAGRS